MRKVNNQYIDRLVKKFINENIHEKADDIMAQINELGGMEDSHPKFGGLNLSKLSDKQLEDLLSQPIHTDDNEEEFDDEEEFDEEPLYEIEMGESEVCECGGNTMVSEGMCMECGLPKMDEGIYDVAKPFGRKRQSFDYIEEEDDVLDFEDDREEEKKHRRFRKKDDDSEKNSEMSEFCKYQKNLYGPNDERYKEKCTGDSAIKDLASMKMNMNEKLHGGQRKLDANHNGRIDAEDFKMLRRGKKRHMDETDMEEGNAFGDAVRRAKEDKEKEFDFHGKKYHVKESIKLTETEIINLIENIILEKESKGLKNLSKPKGMSEYERAYKGSGKENNDYLKSVTQKMKDYLKDGSEGDYETNPKNFPMGNGELKKSKIKGFNMSDEGAEFIDDYLRPGQENISYDEIHPSDEWMDDIIAGSSKTGNSDEYANSVKTDVNKKIRKKQKDHKLDILSKKAANKSPQPIFATKDKKPGYSDGDGVRLNTNESTNHKKEYVLNEEFNRISELMKYNRSTQ